MRTSRRKPMGRLLFTLPLACLPGAALAQSWSALFEQAWAAHEPVAAARAAQSPARQAAAQRWLAEPPTLTVAARGPGSPSSVDARGQREFEAELALPLTRPGQRDAARQVAEADTRVGLAWRAAERLQLAGALRDAVWTLNAARSEATAATRQQREAEALRDDTERRVAAGELAPLDLNAAHTAALRAATAALRALQSQDEALTALSALVPGGEAPLEPETGPEPTQDAEPGLQAHPALTLLHEQRAAARARLTQADRVRSAAPEIALGLSRERDGAGLPWQQRARVALKLPLGAGARAEVPVREAVTALAEAEWALVRLTRELHSQAEVARQGLLQARRLLALGEQRRALALQALQWTRQAHAAGQFDLPTVLRAQAEAAEANTEVERARVEMARARSRLNQSLGITP